MSDDPYLYPGTKVLRNKLDLHDADQLDYHERELVVQRIRQGAPTGKFDLPHLQAIHRHLFQDVYDWAGEVRTLNISKGGSDFLHYGRIGFGMEQVRQEAQSFIGLRRPAKAAVATQLAKVIGDLNFVHPFREGNGRTQLQFARQLAEKAGHRLDLTRLNGPAWIEASREANDTRYDAMARCFDAALTERERQQDMPGRTGGRGGGDRER